MSRKFRNKAFIALFVLLGAAPFAHARSDFFGNTYIINNIYNASGTATGDSMQTISNSTDVIELGGVIVSNPGNPGAQVGIFDGSFNQIGSTISATSASPYPYLAGIAVSSGGLKYNNLNTTSGGTTAQITILWKYRDFVDPVRRK